MEQLLAQYLTDLRAIRETGTAPNPAHEVLINDYRIIIRAIAAAIPFHERINNSWDQFIQF